ncbi:MAG: hypothetical protein KKF77_04015 [Proteobacteria bacterium]|nr:hypothetical protein [Pseudomonadota bacterium]
MESIFTPEEIARIKELFNRCRDSGKTLQEIGATGEDLELMSRLRTWENSTGYSVTGSIKLWSFEAETSTPAGTMMYWDKKQGRMVPMPTQEASHPRKACANLDCEFNAVTLEPGLFRFAVDRVHGGGRREINCIAFRLGGEKVWLCEDCADKAKAGINIRLS